MHHKPVVALIIALLLSLPGGQTIAVANDAVNYAALVPIPDKATLNPGLHEGGNATLVAALGAPDLDGVDCSSCHNELATPQMKARFVTADVGPFEVRGHEAAVASLKRIFAKVKTEQPDLLAHLHTAGMLCVRWRKKADTGQCFAPASNHSYGTAIDLYFGRGVDRKIDGKCQQGLLALYPYFLAEGWYWGAAFATNEDPMHFELAEETLEQLQTDGKL